MILRKYLPTAVWGLNFYGIRWCGIQLGYFIDWAEEKLNDHTELDNDL